MSTMQAVCLRSRQAEDLAVIEAPVPIPGSGQVQLAPRAAGVCGSDLSAFLAKRNFDWVERPRILGHEFSAVISGIGPGVEGFEVGQAVTAIAMQSCLRCPQCRRGDTNQCRERQIFGFHRDGAMAHAAVCDVRHVMPLREGLSFRAAALIEPLSVASRCVLRNCHLRPGDEVIVCGPGIIGMLCALLARASGARVTITGAPADESMRLQKARDLGFATRVVSAEQPLREQLEAPVDTLIEASGAPPALQEAQHCVRYGGTVSVVATYGQDITLDVTALVRAEQYLQTTMGSNWLDFEAAQDHLVQGRIPVDELVEEFPLEAGRGRVPGIEGKDDAEGRADDRGTMTADSKRLGAPNRARGIASARSRHLAPSPTRSML